MQAEDHKTPATIREQGKELSGFYYNGPFDQRRVIHLLDLVLAVVRHGGQGFLKSLRTALIRESSNPDLTKSALSSE
jgi:hypothetical protein